MLNMRNRRGWIKIVEAFIAVLLIAGVLLYTINQGYIGKRDISEQVYRAQLAVLREIELDSDLRLEVLKQGEEAEDNIPPNAEPYGTVNETIHERIPDYLECTALICPLDNICSMKTYMEKEVYAQAVAIAAQGTKYGPRQLKLFCWTAE